MLGYIILVGRASQFDVYTHKSMKKYVNVKLFRASAVVTFVESVMFKVQLKVPRNW